MSCATATAVDETATEQGMTELRIDARTLLAANLTRVSVEAAGQVEDLVLNPATGTFDGALILPIGSQTLLARAFSGDQLVGLSNPTAVEIATGQVTRVTLRILDITGSPPPVFGPILNALVVPTTAEAGAPVSFTLSVVAPAGDPVAFLWSSSCADSTFSAPDAAVTSWTKPVEGACTITVIASSNGISLIETFGVVVFAAGANRGAVDISGVFVTTPTMFFSFPDLGCFVAPDTNASCAQDTASPATTSFDLLVTNWGGGAPGTIALSDSCGGTFGTSLSNPNGITGSWLPPLVGQLCILTAQAVNGDGVVATLSAAVLVRPGTAPVVQPPEIFPQTSGCFFPSNSGPVQCPAILAGAPEFVFGVVNWADGHPGSLTVTDSCNGGLTQPNNAFSFGTLWQVVAQPGALCTLTVRATNVEGLTSEAIATYPLL